jgi:hypothetical protein
MIYIILIILLLVCIGLAAWSWFLYKRLGNKESICHYYETSEWCKNTTGMHYSQDDENMDSLVYIPNRNIVCWFNGRRIAHVQPNGTFVMKWNNGGRMAGTIHPLDEQIELIGLPGTVEDGVTETIIKST